MPDTDSVTSSLKYNENTLPKTYFDLMKKVGTNGTYQKCVFIIFFMNWFLGGVIVYQPVFLFLEKPFDCKEKGLLVENCEEYVCKLPTMEQWRSF